MTSRRLLCLESPFKLDFCAKQIMTNSNTLHYLVGLQQLIDKIDI